MSKQASERVYLNYDQAALDAQYDQATLVPDISNYLERWAALGRAARESCACHLDIAYGPSAAETLDLYRKDGVQGEQPVHVYFHGGAWRALDKADGGFVAPDIVASNAIFISAGFGLVPAVPLHQQVRQARAVIQWTFRNIRGYGGDPSRITVSGHSSGGHLAACLVSRGWQETFELPADVIKGAVVASGLFDLEPVFLSARNTYLHLGEKDVAGLSPIELIPQDHPPELAVFWGDGDLAEFRRQSRAYAEAWQAAGHTATALELEGANHFDVSDLFATSGSPILNRIQEMLS